MKKCYLYHFVINEVFLANFYNKANLYLALQLYIRRKLNVKISKRKLKLPYFLMKKIKTAV